jgi:hypothetical protein
METCVYAGEASGRWELRAEEAEIIAEKISNIQSYYDDTVPIFSKELLQDVCQQLEKCTGKGQKV